MPTFLGLDAASFGRAGSCASISATNGIASIELAALEKHRHHVVGIFWSYSDTPTGGRLFTSGLEGDELDLDITQGGPGPMLTPPAVGGRGGAVSVSLAAGGAGVVGKLTVFYLTLPG